ncbi:hypothetical protein HNY73_020299 [Argiope bruennichi]|uniref:Uncharacterized protein n=1 Tax=Argiope bruennichi TaxID=94029 RepID=A0A8T0E646_ARGBR|nr:hypothetical protein HNY73_020299 [Argiope bruennichi]
MHFRSIYRDVYILTDRGGCWGKGRAGSGQGEVFRALRINRGGAPRSHDLRAPPSSTPDAISTSCYARERRDSENQNVGSIPVLFTSFHHSSVDMSAKVGRGQAENKHKNVGLPSNNALTNRLGGFQVDGVL